MNWIGKLEPAGITSYQYGTHRLISSDSIFALRSSQIDLIKFENKTVRVSGERMEGYPLEGGPVLIDVSEVEIIKNR